MRVPNISVRYGYVVHIRISTRSSMPIKSSGNVPVQPDSITRILSASIFLNIVRRIFSTSGYDAIIFLMSDKANPKNDRLSVYPDSNAL